MEGHGDSQRPSMIEELTRLVFGSCRLYAVTHAQHAAIAAVAGIVFAAAVVFACIAWTRLFNKSYKLSGLEWASALIPSIIGCLLLPLWLALDFMGVSAKAEIKAGLEDLSLDTAAMVEIRTRVYESLAQKSSVAGQDPTGLPLEARWRFTGRPDDASILFIAKAYSDAIAEALERKSILLSKMLSWDSAPGFLAADIRLHATQKPVEPYDLDPAKEAFAEILTIELTSRMAAYVFAIKVTCASLLVFSVVAVLGWLGFSAYKDIEVHWPSSV